MTPEYASPEQVKGEAITTASDVYSLGVLLYELLTGRRPYKLKRRTTDEITKAICEQEPTKPSSVVSSQRLGVSGKQSSENADPAAASPPDVRKGSAFSGRLFSFFRRGYASEHLVGAQPLPKSLDSRKGAAFPHIGAAEPQSNGQKKNPQSAIHNPKFLRGVLDNIVLKALRKEPQRRYASVEQFSEDIRRHLEGRPVIARKDTLSYRTSKFIQRNKIGVAAGARSLITPLGGIVLSTREERGAHAQTA